MIEGLDRLQKHLSKIANPRLTFDKDFAKVTRQSVRILANTTPTRSKKSFKTQRSFQKNKKTPAGWMTSTITGGQNVRKGWTDPQKIGLSNYSVINKISSVDGKYAIADILDKGRKEIRAKPGKSLYIALSKKGSYKARGADLDGLIYGVDYILTKKSSSYKGTKFITKEIEASGKRLGAAMTATVRGIHNGR